MNCPVCNVPLNMMDRQGVEIDYCAKCRGVWLDRGELDKIIERAATGTSGSTASTQQQNQSGFGQTPPQPNTQSGFGQPPQYPNNPSGFGQPQYPNTQSGYNQPQYPNTHYGQPHYKKKKHESFLSELFDFD